LLFHHIPPCHKAQASKPHAALGNNMFNHTRAVLRVRKHHMTKPHHTAKLSNVVVATACGRPIMPVRISNKASAIENALVRTNAPTMAATLRLATARRYWGVMG
jgi:hypothetical protein